MIHRDGGYHGPDSTRQLAPPWSLHELHPEWHKPFREGSRAEGLEVKSSLGELGC